MTLIRRLILTVALSAGLAPALAQVPPPVPALPDAERRTSYSISASTCACNVNFALYGDSTDYQNWVEVWLNNTLVNFNDATFGWTITVPTQTLATRARPISDAILTFNSVQTGTVQIVGARRPRRTSQFQENTGVPTRNFNVVLSDLTAQNRETWDKINDVTGRGFFALPGHTGAIVSGPLTGIISGPLSPVSGDVAIWNGTSGSALSDGGPLPSVSVETCGAKGDGVTDDAPAIRACAATVGAQATGGTVQFSCNKTYLLGSLAGVGKGILRPYSNVTYAGCGDSSVLRVANGMNTLSTEFAVFYPPDETVTYTYNNSQWRNFKIDFNGANNNCGNTCFYQNVGVGVRFGDNVGVDNVSFLHNPGSQDVSFGNNPAIQVSRAFVRNSRSTDACDAVNSACTDHSDFYGVAQDFKVTGSSCTQTVQSTKLTCIEGHGLELNFSGNADFNVAKSFNIAAQIGHVANTASITNHTSFGTSKGIQLFALNGLNFNNINISNNVWRRSATNVNPTVAFIDFDQSVTSTGTTNLIFTNNIIDGAAITAATTDITPAVLIGRGANTVIEGNKITGNSGECIGGGTFAAATSITIRNNILIDCGQTSVAGHKRGILINSGTSIDSFTMSGNKVENVASAYMTTGIDLTLTATYGFLMPDNIVNNVATQITSALTGFNSAQFNGVMIGQGNGFVPTSTAPLTNGQLVVGQTGAAPLPKTITGDCTLSLAGAVTCTQSAGAFTVNGLLTVTGNLNVGGSIIDANGILATNIVAPATPAAGTTRIYVDSTQKVLTFKNDAGTVGNAVVPSTCAGGQFGTSISAAGVFGCSAVSVAVGSITGLGTGVASALAVNVGSAGAFTTFNGAHGTPSSITLTNGTGLPYAALPSLAANQLLGALTATTPSGQSVPSCSTAASALQWTSGTGFACNTSITAAAVPASGLTGATLAAGVTASSLTSLGGGTVGTGAFAATGTSGHTIPFLDGANVFSGTNWIFGVTTGSPADMIAVNSTANKGVTVYNGTGSVQTFLRWNSGSGGYIGVLDTAAGNSTQIQGTGDTYIAAPAAGASTGFNTQATLPAAQTGNSKWLTMNGAIQHAKNTVANLPTCNAAAEGSHFGVTDAAATPVYNAIVAAGGTVHIAVYCNGTNWVNQ